MPGGQAWVWYAVRRTTYVGDGGLPSSRGLWDSFDPRRLVSDEVSATNPDWSETAKAMSWPPVFTGSEVEVYDLRRLSEVSSTSWSLIVIIEPSVSRAEVVVVPSGHNKICSGWVPHGAGSTTTRSVDTGGSTSLPREA